MKRLRIPTIIISLFFVSAAIAYAGEQTVTTTSASNDIVAQLQEQVAQLQKQIASMQAQLEALAGKTYTTTKNTEQKETKTEEKTKTTSTEAKETTTVSGYKVSKYLYIGLKDDEVYLLQEFLASDPDVYPEAEVTGYYGNLTEAAVKRFQEKYGIEIVGVVGPKTREKLNALMEKEGYTYTKKTTSNTSTKEKETSSDVVSVVDSIALTGDNSGKIEWDTDGYSKSGFKIVWSKTSEPTYPTRKGDTYQYLSSSNASQTTLTAFDGEGVYYVRVCEYLGGKCGTYSNQISLTLSKGETSKEDTTADADDAVESIVLTAGDSGKISWQTEGYSEKGFKIVWSKTSGPTYPTRSGDKYQYLSSPSADNTTLTAFDGTGDYYVRVCEYLGGKCGLYSNQVEMSLTK